MRKESDIKDDPGALLGLCVMLPWPKILRPFDPSTGSRHRMLRGLPIPKFVEPVETNPEVTSILRTLSPIP